MWLDKIGLKAAALALVGAVSSMAAGIEPLTFGGSTGSDVDNWNYLINYKMWGQTGISFGNNNLFEKADGWVGSSGNLTSTGNDAKIAGAIIVAGKADNTGKMAFTTGPVRTGKGITDASRVSGVTCPETSTAGDCKDVPLYKSGLTIPTLKNKPANNHNNISVGDHGTSTVDLSNGPYDLFIDSFSMGQEATVIIKMPKGQIVHIFTESFSTKEHPNIVVQYPGENFYRCNSKTGEFKCGGEYEGNLLIYVNSDVTFRNVDYHPIVGTIVSSGTINIICNMGFAGQLMAKTLTIGNEVKGDGFKFVPIKRTPKIVLSQKDATFKEDNKLHEIGIALSSSEGEEDVTFNYCFEFNNKSVPGEFAEKADVTIDNTYDFPICGTKEIKVTIKKGDLVSDQKIQIKPFIDGVVEKPATPGEKLWLVIKDLKGAEVSKDNYDETRKGFNLYITDSDEFPSVSSVLKFDVDEDSKHTFSSSEFNFVHSTRTFASVKIVTYPDKGSLLLNGTAVTKGQTITVADLAKLTYAPAANDFGNNYTTFKYQVIGSGTGDNTSIEYTATVNVVPVNDKPTTESKYTFTVSEEPGKDLVLGYVTNSDVSNELSKDTYKFTLVSSSTGYADFSAKFELTSDGKVKVKGTQTFSYYDTPSYTVKAIVTDNAATEWSGKSGNKGPLSSDQFTIVVDVKNQNHAPTISDQSFELPEKNKTTSGIVDWTSSKVVGNVSAKDPDGDNLTYKVETTGIPFDFKPGSNALIVKDGSALDYETKSVWSFKVSVTDPSGASASATITVNLTDVNEPPELKNVLSEYSVEENKATGTTFGSFEVVDRDASETLTYSLSGNLNGAVNNSGNLKNKSLADIFTVKEAVSGNTRTVSFAVKDGALLDYEDLYKTSTKNATYPVTVTITDKGSNSVTVKTNIAVIDVNEDLAATGGTFYLQEHSPGGSPLCTTTHGADGSCATYAKITGTDKDKYTDAFKTLKYSISKNNSGAKATDAASFTIDNNSGALRTAINAQFEYDGAGQRKYEFLVTVSDGSFSHDVTVIVVIEDIKEPTVSLATIGSGAIPEHSSRGTSADKFTKDVLPQDEQDKFDALGEEKDISYTIDKTASAEAEKIFTIVSDPNEPQHGSILVKTNNLDFETLYKEGKTTFTVKIIAKGPNGELEIVRNIDVLDINEAPSAEDFSKSVDENIAGGTVIGTVKATDPDDAYGNFPHPSAFNQLYYSIVDDTNLPFEINPGTGEISLRSGEKLSFKKQQKYEFKVKVTDRSTDADNPPLSTTANVTITVNDVNEPPEFKVLADLYEVKENTDVGTKFGDKIVVFDDDNADLCDDSKCPLSISIKDKNATCKTGLCAQDLFEVVRVENTNANLETPFKFVVKKDLDYETLYKSDIGDAIFDVTLTIKDEGDNLVSKDTKVRVIDVNEEPKFVEDKYEFTVREKIKIDSVLGKAVATDPDIYNPAYGTLYFSLDGDADQIANFYIDESTGEIHVISNPKLDYETTETYKFNAVVTDKNTTKKVPVTITVVNESEPPEFPPDTPTKLYVDENTLAGTELKTLDNLGNLIVAEIVAVDDDCKNKHDCKAPTYSLAEADGAASDYTAFSIDPAKGIITVAKDSILNYEEKKTYSVRVIATDGSNSALKDTVVVTINVNDVNDAPKFDKPKYEFEVAENQAAGEVVGSVFASDEDTWSVLTFTISDYTSGSKDSEVFTINDNGRISTKKTLNYEEKKVYQIVVTATDNGKSKGFENYSTTTVVTINVLDKPDPPVIKDDGKAGYGVNEVTETNDIKNGSIVKDTKDGKDVCYEVKDEDAGQIEKLVAYVTDLGNTDADRLFDAIIKETSGGYNLCLTVKNASALDYEALTHEHKIKIAVMDADQKTAGVEKTVTLVDVNEMPLIIGNLGFSFYDEKSKGSVIGKLNPADVDTSLKFTDDVYAAIGGDTASFTITEDGKIKTKREFNFQTEEKTTFELKVTLSDRDASTYPKLTTSATITITVKNTPKPPTITSKEFSVDENSEGGTVIGQIKSDDPDGNGNLLYSLEEDSPYVEVSSDGQITVREGADIDYEKMKEFTITVSVKDNDGLSDEAEIVIKVNDLNEKPTIKEQTIEFPEDTPPGTKKGPIEAKDPDTKKEFNVLEFYPLEESSVFDITKDGDIVLKEKLDYESVTSYSLTVRVVDPKGLADTATITINVGNVIEVGEVTITRAEVRDSVYLDPDTLYVNADKILVEWKQNGQTKSSLDSLHEGKNIIIKSFKDSTQDIAGSDTLVVFYSTAAPIVEVAATKTKVEADNIYTIVEEVDKKDSSIYVNKKTKEVTVTVKDTVSDYEEKFNVEVVLDTISVSKKDVQTMVDVSKSKPSLEDKPKDGISETPINGEKTKVSFKKTVNGTKVTISYDVDDKGDMIKLPVINADGEKVMTEVIEVSTVVEAGGKDVVVSYKADAKTGKILYGDSEGNLMVEAPSSSSKDSKKSDEVDLKTGVGAFTVTYDFKGVEGNKATVSYVIDEKGKVVANEEGDRGYLVTYTYTNRYGNSADKSVFMVLDKLAPIVKILSPTDGQVVYANFVDVDWCIAVDGDEDNCVKQDTLNFQSLEKGVNTIKRIYRDKAGNETIAKLDVMMKKAKDVNITLEEPMIIVTADSVKKYYEINPPIEDEKYAVSVLNPKTQAEKEVIVGTTKKNQKGSGEEPYAGYDGHLGPTIKIDMKVPLVSAVGGLATLDDIIINGDMIALDGVDAKDSKKMTVKEYVEEYCSEDFQEKLTKDYSKATLYATTAHVTLWFFTTSGSFVDKYYFEYDVNDPDYVDKTGLVKLFFEMKLDKDGELKDKNGRLYGTGPFIVKTKVEIRSKLRCTVPPVDGNAKVGDVIKSSDELLKRFGYRRPVLRKNEKAEEKTTKNSKSSKKSDSKSKK